MSKSKGEQIWVWLDDPAYGELQQIGTLSREDRGSVRFSYEPYERRCEPVAGVAG